MWQSPNEQGESQPFDFDGSSHIVEIHKRTDPVPVTLERAKEYIRAELEGQQHERLDAELAARLLRDADFTVYDQVILQMLEADRATHTAP